MAALLLGLETALYLSNRLQVYIGYWATLPATLARANFEACLVEFHALILRFLAGAIRVYQKGSITRGFEAFWRIEDVSSFEDKCNKMASRADIEASNCDRDLSASDRASAQQQQKDLGRILKQLEDIHIIQTDIDMLDIKFDFSKLPVVAGAGFDSHQDELDARCHPDTRVDLLGDIYSNLDEVVSAKLPRVEGALDNGNETIGSVLTSFRRLITSHAINSAQLALIKSDLDSKIDNEQEHIVNKLLQVGPPDSVESLPMSLFITSRDV
jgi:hypothetical protein